MARSILQAAGWNVIYLGADVPTEEFAEQLRVTGASLICVSIFPPRGLADTVPVVQLLDMLSADSFPVDVAIGGAGLSTTDRIPYEPQHLRAVRAFGAMKDFEEWVSEIDVS
jgi:methanogenic corrinoid protein MtbC1